jgi:hypothetical protein
MVGLRGFRVVDGSGRMEQRLRRMRNTGVYPLRRQSAPPSVEMTSVMGWFGLPLLWYLGMLTFPKFGGLLGCSSIS